MRSDGLFTAALRRLRPVALLWLVLGNAVAAVAAALWLLIPDSHAWQLVVSVLFGGLILAAFFTFSALALRAVRSSAPELKLWKAAVLLGGLILLAFVLSRVVVMAVPGVELRAGLWNSKLPAGLRGIFTYQRLTQLQNAAIEAAGWVVLPGLLAPFAVEGASYGLTGGAMRRCMAILSSWRHWAVAFVTLGLADWLVPAVVAWHPTHTVSGEVASAVLRLGLAGLLAVAACVLLLAVDGELLARVTATPLRPPEFPADR